jgi:hypothetical protein
MVGVAGVCASAFLMGLNLGLFESEGVFIKKTLRNFILQDEIGFEKLILSALKNDAASDR